MAAQDQGSPFPPPGLFASLSAGFEAIANNIAVILIPIIIDLFLWVGPHLRIKSLIAPLINDWSVLAREGLFAEDIIKQAQEMWSVLAEQFNILTVVRTFPVGVPSLIAGLSPTKTPFGADQNWQIDTLGSFFGVFVLTWATGWILGSMYLYWVSHVTLRRGKQLQQSISPIWAMSQSVVLMLFWLMLSLMALIPGLLILSVFMLISPVLAQLIYFAFGITAVWILLPVYFSTHGIVVYGQHAVASIVQSFKLVRYTLPTTGLLVLSMFIISQGLAYLWRTPPENSWMLLVGIVGHAFVSTSLVAGGFIYYRDTNAWLQVMLERLKAHTTSPSAQA